MSRRIAIPNSTLQAFLSIPTTDVGRTPLLTPAVLVLHAWWGVDASIEGVCDRLAALGYVALAPDLYAGRTATTRAVAETLRNGLDRGQGVWDLGAALSFLQHDTAVRVGRVGALGFSLGGSMAWRLAARRPGEIASLVTFYGLAADVEPRSLRIQAQGHFADEDEFVTAGEVDEWRQQLNGAPGASAEFHVHAGTTHGFFESPLAGDRRPAASQTAWDRTLAYFDRTLT